MISNFLYKYRLNGLLPVLAVIFMSCTTVLYPFPAECGNAIHLAAYHGNVKKVRALLNEGVDVDDRDSFGGTALHAAMFQNDLEVIRMLIDAGYDVNAQGSSNGFTPLHDAVWANNLEGARMLVEAGARLDIRDNKDQTPYEKAGAEGRTRLLEVLKN